MTLSFSFRRVLDVITIGGSMIGSLIIAMHPTSPILFIVAYWLYLAGAIASVIILRITKGAGSLLFINCYFTVVNVIGIIQYSS